MEPIRSELFKKVLCLALKEIGGAIYFQESATNMGDLVDIQRRLRRRRNGGNVGRQLRDRTNPLEDLEPDEIFRRYRFVPEDIMMIVGLVADHVEHPTARALALPAVYAVLVSLQYLATGTFHTVLSDTVNVHSTTVGRGIHRFIGAMDHIAHQYTRFPTGDAAVQTKLSFARIAGKWYTQCSSNTRTPR